MSKKFLAVLGLCLTATLLIASGCGKDLGYRKTTGVVTVDGKPIEGATVMFVSQSGGESGAGTTDANGAYSVKCGSVGEGLKPGDYVVTVTKRQLVVDPDQAAFDAGEIDYDELQNRKASKARSGSELGESETPEIYGDMQKTPLKATVTDTPAKNKFDFNLEI